MILVRMSSGFCALSHRAYFCDNNETKQFLAGTGLEHLFKESRKV